MNKVFKLALLLFVVVVLASSCKKDDNENEINDKVTLVKKITTRFVDKNYLGQPDVTIWVEKFEYDDKNRLTVYDFNFSNYRFVYSYNANDEVTDLIRTEGIDGGYKQHYKFPNSSNIIGCTEYYPDGSFNTLFEFVLNANNIVTQINYNHSSQYDCIYDDRGNVTEVKTRGSVSQPNDTRTFDDKKNPFLMVKGFNPHFKYVAYMDTDRRFGIRANFNNATSAINRAGINAGNKIYTYNSDGFPVTSATTFANTTDTEDEVYEYIVK